MTPPVLAVESLSAGYGQATVVNGVSLAIEQGEIVAMLGHNGAGKSTILKTVMGLVRARSGSISFDGTDITSLAPSSRVNRGLCLVPQTNNVFSEMTIYENIDYSMRIAQPDAAKRAVTLARIYDLFPILKERSKLRAKSLSGGQRQMLGISLALAKEPKVLLLDEPSLGLAPVLVERVFESISDINREFGTTVLVVEQNVNAALEIASRAYIIQTGRVFVSSSAESILQREDLFSVL
jgi:branched-chain amino acid transport system ATP-binding protein